MSAALAVRAVGMDRQRHTPSGFQVRASVVLLVEASPAVLAPFAELLRREGLAVIEAGDGQEALDHVRAIHPDIVITDLYLPILDGLSLVDRLKDDASTRRIPVIGLVGRATKVAPLRAAGFSLILRKPCNPRLLLRRVRSVLDRPAWHDACSRWHR
jgi:CheY-like chemotaxis protein